MVLSQLGGLRGGPVDLAVGGQVAGARAVAGRGHRPAPEQVQLALGGVHVVLFDGAEGRGPGRVAWGRARHVSGPRRGARAGGRGGGPVGLRERLRRRGAVHEAPRLRASALQSAGVVREDGVGGMAVGPQHRAARGLEARGAVGLRQSGRWGTRSRRRAGVVHRVRHGRVQFGASNMHRRQSVRDEQKFSWLMLKYKNKYSQVSASLDN